MTRINNPGPSTDGQLNLPLVAAGLNLSSSDEIDNLTSAKSQAFQPCPSCGSTEKQISPGVSTHAARLDCKACGRYLKWIKKMELPALKAIESAFGGDSNE